MQQPIGQNDPVALAGAKGTQYFDRKSARIKPNAVARHIVAFANAAGGKLAIGIEDNGEITGYRMRVVKSKLTTVKARQSCGYETIAAGDSFNDLGMIRASKAGFLFRSTDAIKADNPDLLAFEEYDDLLKAIEQAL